MAAPWLTHGLGENGTDTEGLDPVEDSDVQVDWHPRIAQVPRGILVAADQNLTRKMRSQDSGSVAVTQDGLAEVQAQRAEELASRMLSSAAPCPALLTWVSTT